jgi:large subunit ribosomal protein L4e
MKAKLLDKTGKLKKELDLPKNFSVKIREDILQKVFEALKSWQTYGAMEGAGAGYSASGILRHRRHVWKTTYGKGIARVPRKIMSRSGSSFNWVGATVSSTRGGRKPNAPRSEKDNSKKINKKEFLIALNSALAGSIESKYLEKKYGEEINTGIVFDSSVTELKTKEFLKVMEKIFEKGFGKVLKKKSVRAGRGKTRGRKYKSNSGLLFVIGKDEKMARKGIDVVNVNELEIKNLAPNGKPGRITCYTENAIKEIGETFK